MNKNSEPEPEPAVETDDARESVRGAGPAGPAIAITGNSGLEAMG